MLIVQACLQNCESGQEVAAGTDQVRLGIHQHADVIQSHSHVGTIRGRAGQFPEHSPGRYGLRPQMAYVENTNARDELPTWTARRAHTPGRERCELQFTACHAHFTLLSRARSASFTGNGGRCGEGSRSEALYQEIARVQRV